MRRSKSPLPIENKPYNAEQNRLGLERLMFFSDAVFAIAITVLVLEIHLPTGVDVANDRQLLSILGGLWTKYFAYLISFWVIGRYWLNHHRKFLYIKRFDYQLLSYNLLLLMVIAFIPFPTEVMSENGNRTASIFYATIMALAGLLLTLLWYHATRNHNLIDFHISKQQVWREMVGPLAIAALFLISIGISFLDAGLVRLFWLLIIPASLLLNLQREAA
jgi:uncharacterized membrane protein